MGEFLQEEVYSLDLFRLVYLTDGDLVRPRRSALVILLSWSLGALSVVSFKFVNLLFVLRICCSLPAERAQSDTERAWSDTERAVLLFYGRPGWAAQSFE